MALGCSHAFRLVSHNYSSIKARESVKLGPPLQSLLGKMKDENEKTTP